MKNNNAFVQNISKEEPKRKLEPKKSKKIIIKEWFSSTMRIAYHVLNKNREQGEERKEDQAKTNELYSKHRLFGRFFVFAAAANYYLRNDVSRCCQNEMSSSLVMDSERIRLSNKKQKKKNNIDGNDKR